MVNKVWTINETEAEVAHIALEAFTKHVHVSYDHVKDALTRLMVLCADSYPETLFGDSIELSDDAWVVLFWAMEACPWKLLRGTDAITLRVWEAFYDRTKLVANAILDNELHPTEH